MSGPGSDLAHYIKASFDWERARKIAPESIAEIDEAGRQIDRLLDTAQRVIDSAERQLAAADRAIGFAERQLAEHERLALLIETLLLLFPSLVKSAGGDPTSIEAAIAKLRQRAELRDDAEAVKTGAGDAGET